MPGNEPKSTGEHTVDPIGGEGVQPTLGPRDHGAMDSLAYDLLRSRARQLMAHEAAGHTLQPTALVHEAYLRLAEVDLDRWTSRAHFLAVASRAMRRILIDHARTRSRQKRGDGWHRVTLQDDLTSSGTPRDLDPLEMIHLDRCLSELEREHARLGQVAEMKLFGGMTAEEISESLGVSQRTVEGDWAFARRWLGAALAGDGPRDAR